MLAKQPYGAHGASLKVWKSRAKEILIDGPAGTGKTRGDLEKAFAVASKYSGARIAFIRQTRKSLTESVLVTWEELVVPKEHPILSGAGKANRQAYDFPNGSHIAVAGLDKPDRVMSTEWDMIIVFEAIETQLEAFEKLGMRLRWGRVPYQQIIAETNPSFPNHWLKVRADDPTNLMERYPSRHTDNPRMYDQKTMKITEFGEEYLSRLGSLTGHRKARYLKGLWVASEGMVYEIYDAVVHHIPRFAVPKSWRRMRAIDFGSKNPFVCQWWAIDPDGRMYMYREIYESELLVEDVAKKIVRLSRDENIEVTVADHDRAGRATLNKYGVPTRPAYKAIETGIEAVYKRMRPAIDGKPRIFIMQDSLVRLDSNLVGRGIPTYTAEEYENYLYPKSVDGRILKELPVDEHNHGMDAKRYAVAYVDKISKDTGFAAMAKRR